MTVKSEHWVEVLERLWIGDTDIAPRADMFDAVVTLGADTRSTVELGIRHQWYQDLNRYDIPDVGRMRQLADWAAKRWQVGDRVLVRSLHGKDRAGLLVSKVVFDLGATTEEAIRLTRSARAGALSFEYLRRIARAA